MRAVGRLLIPGLLSVPLLPLVLELASFPVLSAGNEAVRVSELLGQTTLLVLTTLCFTIPPGVLLAWALFRTNAQLASFVRWTLLAGVFVPLPVFACAWQPTLGFNWPWGRGILFASLIHSLAALPGVVWIIGLGLKQVSREREEEASLTLSPMGVMRRVTLPAIRANTIVAIIWVILQTTGEITVTDMALVRTFAEEVYTQFVAGDSTGLGRAVAMCLPVNMGLFLMLVVLGRNIEIQGPKLMTRATSAKGDKDRSLVLTILLGGFWIAWAGIPLWNLLRQASGHRTDRPGDLATLSKELSRAIKLNYGVLGESLLESLAVGMVGVLLALLLGELAKKSAWQRRLTIGVIGALAVTPGPVLGFGFLRTIMLGMNAENFLLSHYTDVRPFRFLFYDGPTPAAVMCVQVLRFLPVSALFVWPSLWRIPTAFTDSARLEGATGWQMFRRITWPAACDATLVGGIVTMAFALGEVSAGKIVQVPGRVTFSQELLNQMHYGVTSTVAGLAFVQLTTIVVLMLVIELMARSSNSRKLSEPKKAPTVQSRDIEHFKPDVG